MAVTIHDATVDDAAEMSTVAQLALADNLSLQEFFNVRTLTPEQAAHFEQWRTNLYKTREADHRLWKAVDDSTGAIVGFTIFGDPAVSPEHTEALVLPDYANKKLFEERTEKTKAMVDKYVGNRTDVWKVKSMAVHPEHQRQGIGKKLLQHGLGEVDKMGGATYLESTPKGRFLYLPAGFEEIDKIEMLDGRYTMTIMLRPNQR